MKARQRCFGKVYERRRILKMPVDSIIMSMIVLLLAGAACFYLYMRISFLERKATMTEAVLVDMKVAIDSLMSAGRGGNAPPAPISPGPPMRLGTDSQPAHISGPVPMDPSEAETIPEESFYSSVLDQAHDEAAEAKSEEDSGAVTLDKAMAGLDQAVVTDAPTLLPSGSEPDLDLMTKPDLLVLAEKRGLRVKKSQNRNEILTLLRRVNPLQNSDMKAGAENVSGSSGGVSQNGASLDGTASVDLGQGGASLE